MVTSQPREVLVLTHSEVTRKARLALITRARRVGKPAKFDGGDDGFRTGASGKDDVPYTPAAKKLAAAKAAKSSPAKAAESEPVKAPAKAPAKRTPRQSPRARAREAMAHADEARERIERWLDSDRSTDPLAGMSQQQLKGAADALGVTVEGRATAPRLKTAILHELADADLHVWRFAYADAAESDSE